jgi:hypothetical protein
MSRILLNWAGCLLLVGAGLAATGCQQPVTAENVRSDLTPELQSVAMSSEQRKNNINRTIDTNLREVWDDFDAVLFLDRPLRMSRYPIP